jgi:hypothetical protein
MHWQITEISLLGKNAITTLINSTFNMLFNEVSFVKKVSVNLKGW